MKSLNCCKQLLLAKFPQLVITQIVLNVNIFELEGFLGVFLLFWLQLKILALSSPLWFNHFCEDWLLVFHGWNIASGVALKCKPNSGRSNTEEQSALFFSFYVVHLNAAVSKPLSPRCLSFHMLFYQCPWRAK